METLDIIIYAAIAAFLASRLWSVLGQKEEGENKQKNPFSTKEKEEKNDDRKIIVIESKMQKELPAGLTSNNHAPTSLIGSLEKIKKIDPSFDEKEFLSGAKIAFNKIVSSFAKGNLSKVKQFLGPAVKDPFEKAIEERKSLGQILENKIEKIVAADIVSVKQTEALVTLGVEFISHQVNLLKDSNNKILSGKENKAEEIRDFWVFQRDMKSQNPNWKLIETRS